jgi:hypothetical protein
MLRWDPTTQGWVGAGVEVPVQEDQVGPWQPLRSRALALRIALYVFAAVSGVAAISDAFEIELLSRIQDGQTVSDGEVNFNDIRQGVIGLVQTGLLLTTVVLFLMWFSRAYHNVPKLGVRLLRYGRGWSIGAWFVPILSLFRPKQIANDIWRGSDPDLPRAHAGNGWHSARVPRALFGFWWAAYLITNVMGSAAIRNGGESIAQLKEQSTIFLVSDLTDLVAAVLCAAVVTATTRRQEERARRYGFTAMA